MKAKVAIEALRGNQTIAEIALKYKVHPKQVMRWRDQLIEESGHIFINKRTLEKNKKDPEKDELYYKIGQQAMDIEYLKKKLGK